METQWSVLSKYDLEKLACLFGSDDTGLLVPHGGMIGSVNVSPLLDDFAMVTWIVKGESSDGVDGMRFELQWMAGRLFSSFWKKSSRTMDNKAWHLWEKTRLWTMVY